MTVEIRKSKRDDIMQKRRNVPTMADTNTSTDDEDLRGDNLTSASLETIVEKAQSAEPATQLAAVQVKKNRWRVGVGWMTHLWFQAGR